VSTATIARDQRDGGERCLRVHRQPRPAARATPLWIYVLKEAEAFHDGDRLGPVGGRIVGEVLVGIADVLVPAG